MTHLTEAAINFDAKLAGDWTRALTLEDDDFELVGAVGGARMQREAAVHLKVFIEKSGGEDLPLIRGYFLSAFPVLLPVFHVSRTVRRRR